MNVTTTCGGGGPTLLLLLEFVFLFLPPLSLSFTVRASFFLSLSLSFSVRPYRFVIFQVGGLPSIGGPPFKCVCVCVGFDTFFIFIQFRINICKLLDPLFQIQ